MKPSAANTARALPLALAAALLAAAAGTSAQQAKPVPAKPSAAELLKMDDGRSGRGNLIATTGIRGFAKPASNSAHALIMTIGDYQGGVPKLSGVVHDDATATEIARRLGVPDTNIRRFKDGQLTLEGMQRALDELEARLGGDDQVFIYYSGHGGRQLVREESGAERCAESLISVDGRGLPDTELEARLKRIAGKSQKTIVFVDACHSGGVTTRSTGPKAFAPKSYTPPGQNCSKPTNVLTRNIRLVKDPGAGGANFVHIAAARDSEISLDQPGRGGVASQAWLACLSGDARDSDGSGGLSAEEIRACAQQRINDKLANAPGFLPHHVSINGNGGIVMSYAVRDTAPAATPAAAPAQAAPAAVPPAPTVAPSPPPDVAQAPVPPAPPAAAAPPVPPVTARPSPLAALNDIHASRDDRRLVTVSAPRTALKIGRDVLDFTITSREGGYAYVLMAGSDGKSFDLLFPNQLDRNNQIAPGASLRLPGAAWQIGAEGPPGRNTLLILVADAPRDFSAAGLTPSGPFSSVQAVAAKDIQLVTAGSAQPTDAECSAPPTTRTLAVRKRCSTSYAAALLTIEEVR